MKYPTKLSESKSHGKVLSFLVKSLDTIYKPTDPPVPPTDGGTDDNTPPPPPDKPEIGLPPEEVPTPPNMISCHSTSNHVWFSFNPPRSEDDGWVPWSDDQRYAINVGDEIFNEDHSLSILGQQFELHGRTFSIPYSSGYTAAIYVDEYTDDTPLKVTFIPSGVSEYDTIYEVNMDGGVDSDVEYINKDTAFSVCLKPDKVERLFTCVGATNSLVLDYTNNPEASKSMYVVINERDTCWYDYNSQQRTQWLYDWDYDTDRAIKGWINGVMVNNKLILTIETNIVNDSNTYKVVIHNQETLIEDNEVTIDNDVNPSAYYNKNKKTIQACILPVPPTVEDEDDAPSTGGGDGSSQIGYYRYQGTHQVTNSSVRGDLYANMNQAIKLAKDDWTEWYSTRQHIREETFKPTQVSYFRVKWGDEWRYYSNHIRYTKEISEDKYNTRWTWHELIGDGNTYYLVKDADVLLAEGKSRSDFYPVEPAVTFDTFLNESLSSRIKYGVMNTVGPWEFEEDISGSIMPNIFHYVAPYYHVYPGNSVSFIGNVGITAEAVTAVAFGTVTSPTIAAPHSLGPSFSVHVEKLDMVPNPYS